LAKGEGTGCDDDVAGEAHAAFEGDTACFGDEAGGSGHRKALITHDALRDGNGYKPARFCHPKPMPMKIKSTH